MKAAIHYIVKGRFIRCTTADQIDFVNFEESFVDENPILAREKAFDYLENYLHVLGLSSENTLDRFKPENEEIEIDSTKELFDTKHEYSIEELKAKILHDVSQNVGGNFRDVLNFNYGIGIFLIMNLPIPHPGIDLKDFEPEDYPIYGIDYDGVLFDLETIIDGLTTEYDYYKHFKYETKGYETKVSYHYSGKSLPEEENILKTPFDWNELFDHSRNKASIEPPELLTGDVLPTEIQTPVVKSTLINDNTYLSTKVKELLKKGEGKAIEYKTTLLFNPETQKGIKGKGIIAKTICSFLNSIGGHLLIGVNDKSVPVGLNADFKRSNKSDPKDFFKLEFDKMIRNNFNKKVHLYVNGDFLDIDGKVIFLVTIEPSHRPVFMNWYEEKLFFIRGQASSELLTDIETIVEYCLDQKCFLKS